MSHLYADENFPRPVVDELRRLGHDVLTTREAGKSDQRIPDDEVLAFARSQGRAVLTQNRRDFMRLHAKEPSHSGIVVCTLDANFPRLAGRIHTAIEPLADLNGQLVRVYRPRD